MRMGVHIILFSKKQKIFYSFSLKTLYNIYTYFDKNSGGYLNIFTKKKMGPLKANACLEVPFKIIFYNLI